MIVPQQDQKESQYFPAQHEYPRLTNSQVQLRRLKRHSSQQANTTHISNFKISPSPNNILNTNNSKTNEDLTVVASALYEKKQFEAKKSTNVFVIRGKKNMLKKKQQGQSPQNRSGSHLPLSYRKEDLSFEQLLKLYGVTLSQYKDPKHEIQKVLQPKTFYNSQRGVFRILSMNTHEDNDENLQLQLHLRNNSVNNNNNRCNSVQKMRGMIEEMKQKKTPLPNTSREQQLLQANDQALFNYRARSHTAATTSQLFPDSKQNATLNTKPDVNALEAYYNFKEKDLFDVLKNKQHVNHQEIAEWSKNEYTKNRNDHLLDQNDILATQIQSGNSSRGIRVPINQQINSDKKFSQEQSLSQQLQPYLNCTEAKQSNPSINENIFNYPKVGNLFLKKSNSQMKKNDQMDAQQTPDQDQLSPKFQKYPDSSYNNSKKALSNQQQNIQKAHSPQSEDKKKVMIQNYKDSIEKIHLLQQIKSNKPDTQSSQAKKLADSISAQTLNQWSQIAKKRTEQENQSYPLPAFYITKKVFSKPTHIIPVDQYKRIPGNFKAKISSPQKDEIEELL